VTDRSFKRESAAARRPSLEGPDGAPRRDSFVFDLVCFGCVSNRIK